MIDIIGMVLALIGMLKPNIPCAIVALILLTISCCIIIDKFKNYIMSKKGCFLCCLLYFIFIVFALIPICS